MKKKSLAVAMASVCALSALCAFSGCDLNLYTPNYEEWTKDIVDYAILSSVRVEETERETLADIEGDVSQGSGIIFYATQEHYYALTNNHVVYKNYQGATSSQSVEIVNAYDGKHTASIVYQDSSYDLAVVVFNKKNHKMEDVALTVTSIATVNPTGLEAVAAVGSPDGRHNATTFGKVLRYESVSIGGGTTEEESNVQFPALVHDAYTLSGSSGCAILNEQLQLVGIHYACGSNQAGGFVEGYAIPAEKIMEFLLAAEEATGEELGV